MKLWAFIKLKKQFLPHVTVRKIKKNSLYKVIARILSLGFSVVAQALGSQRQVERCEFEASLVYILTSWLDKVA